MSDNQLYNILESFNKVVKKTLNEDTTRIRRVGNNTEVDDGSGDKTVYDEKSWDDHTDDDTDEKSMGATGFNESEGGGQKFGVYSVGGSIGEKKDGKPIKTFDTKEEAQADAKRRRKHLSPGERKHYKMGYKVKPISEGMEDDIINDKYADLDIDEPGSFDLGDFKVGGDDFSLDDDDIGMDFNMEGYGDEYGADDSFEKPGAEVNDDLFNDPDFSAGTDFDLGDDDIGMDFNFESDEDPMDPTGGMGKQIYDHPEDDPAYDDFEEPEYTPFDAKAQGKRLRAGTPIVFDDSIGGGTGTFIEKSPSGFFGTAERNGKSINIHLNDIVAADLINDSIYENFETQFSELMEGMEGLDMSAGQTAYAPEQQAQTVTVTADIPVDSLVDILKLTGLSGQESDQGVYDLAGDSEVPTGQEMAQEPDMQSMLDTVDNAEQDNGPENESKQGYGRDGGHFSDDENGEPEYNYGDDNWDNDDDEPGTRAEIDDEPENESNEGPGYAPEKKEGDAPFQNYRKDEAPDQYDKKTGKWSRSDDEEKTNETMNVPFGSQQGGPSPEDEKELETEPRDDDDERFDRFGNAIDPANESIKEGRGPDDDDYADDDRRYPTDDTGYDTDDMAPPAGAEACPQCDEIGAVAGPDGNAIDCPTCGAKGWVMPSVEEGIGDTIKKAKRGFNKAFWWDGYRTPKDMEEMVRGLPDDKLEELSEKGYDAAQGSGSGTPRSFQIKIINRELRRRGLRDFKKYGDTRKMTDDVEEGIGDTIKKGIKSVKRGMQGWEKNDWSDDPKQMRTRHSEYDTDTLNRLKDKPGRDTSGRTKHSPQDLQQKLINRELKKRGEVEEEFANEPDERMASADTQLNAMSGGLNKQKRMFNKGYPGDNSMQVDESAQVDSFLNLYKKFNQI